eukprot:1088188-Pyramimonas_sp.AAC.2
MAQQHAVWSMAAAAQLAELCGAAPRDAARRGLPVRCRWQKAVRQPAYSIYGHAVANEMRSLWASLHARVQGELIALGRCEHTRYQRQ